MFILALMSHVDGPCRLLLLRKGVECLHVVWLYHWLGERGPLSEAETVIRLLLLLLHHHVCLELTVLLLGHHSHHLLLMLLLLHHHHPHLILLVGSHRVRYEATKAKLNKNERREGMKESWQSLACKSTYFGRFYGEENGFGAGCYGRETFIALRSNGSFYDGLVIGMGILFRVIYC